MKIFIKYDIITDNVIKNMLFGFGMGLYIKKKLKNLVITAFSPKDTYTQDLPVYWYLYILFPVLTYLLLFLQFGLDIYSLSINTPVKIILNCLIGLCLGLIILALELFSAVVISKVVNIKCDIKKLIYTMSMTYAIPLTINLIGLFINIFNVRTSLSFGITGILFAFIPLLDILYYLTKSRKGRHISLVFVTVIICVTLILCNFCIKL